MDSERGGRIWQRWWYMVAVVVYGYGLVVVYGYRSVVVDGRNDDDGAAA